MLDRKTAEIWKKNFQNDNFDVAKLMIIQEII
jgi:hypothetical protein